MICSQTELYTHHSNGKSLRLLLPRCLAVGELLEKIKSVKIGSKKSV